MSKSLSYNPSKKARKLAAALIVRAEMGGSVTEKLDEFIQGLMKRSGKTREEAEAAVQKRVSEVLKEVSTKSGRKKHVTFFELAKKKLGSKAIAPPEGESDKPVKKADLPPEQKKEQIAALLAELAELTTEDQAEKRKVRRKLRRLGHMGGSRTDVDGNLIEKDEEEDTDEEDEKPTKKAAAKPKKQEKPAKADDDDEEEEDNDEEPDEDDSDDEDDEE